jgi:hypothetical protein
VRARLAALCDACEAFVFAYFPTDSAVACAGEARPEDHAIMQRIAGRNAVRKHAARKPLRARREWNGGERGGGNQRAP